MHANKIPQAPDFESIDDARDDDLGQWDETPTLPTLDVRVTEPVPTVEYPARSVRVRAVGLPADGSPVEILADDRTRVRALISEYSGDVSVAGTAEECTIGTGYPIDAGRALEVTARGRLFAAAVTGTSGSVRILTEHR